MQASGVVFEEGQCVEACAEHGVEVQEVRRDDALCLGGEEFAPGGARAAWCRVDAGVVQGLPDRRRGDPVAEPDRFTVDEAMSQRGFSLASRTTSVVIAARAGGRPMRRRVEWSHLRAMNLRCQASRVPGVTGKTSRQR